MTIQVTKGVKISIESFYQPEYSNPAANEYMFAYRVTIENHNDYPVQLLKRHWQIFDANGKYKEIEGDGVVGRTPVLNLSESHQYVSGCSLKSGMGYMEGAYTFKDNTTNKLFKVKIPRFEMYAQEMLN